MFNSLFFMCLSEVFQNLKVSNLLKNKSEFNINE
jgi:hypothetical protein